MTDTRLLSTTEKMESLDKRISEFVKDLNNIITNKAGNTKSYCSVEFTPDLLDSKDNIYELNPKIESVFIKIIINS